jgi:parallel beta-helix repeat protein
MNDRFQQIEDELNNKVLYRDNPGTEPNIMSTPLDMNSTRILNLPAALSSSEPVTLSQLQAATGSGGGGGEGTGVGFGFSQESQTAVADQTVFTFNSIAYDSTATESPLIVIRNGSTLRPEDYATTSSASITLVTPSRVGDEFQFLVLNSADTIGNGPKIVRIETQTGADVVSSVSTFTTIDYTVGSNSLAVYIQGVQQSLGVDYNETSSTSITWPGITPLATDSVKFIAGQNVSDSGYSTDATLVSYGNTTVEGALDEKVSVKKHGAVGDGGVDDAAAIQAAFNASTYVFIPDGDYTINSDLTLNDNTTVEWGSNATFQAAGSVVNCITLGTNCRLINPRITETRSYASIPNSSKAIYAAEESDIVIEGGEIGLFTYGGMFFAGCTNVSVNGVEVHSTGSKAVNLGRGIRFDTSDSGAIFNENIAVTNCNVHGNGHHGITFFDGTSTATVAKHVTISGNRVYDNGDQGIATEGMLNFTISDNVCLENGDNGNGTGGQGISVGSGGASVPNAQFGAITGNVCSDQVLGYGIELVAAYDIQITGNTTNDNDYGGITIRKGSKRVNISGNGAYSNGGNGIRITGSDGVSSYVLLLLILKVTHALATISEGSM